MYCRDIIQLGSFFGESFQNTATGSFHLDFVFNIEHKRDLSAFKALKIPVPIPALYIVGCHSHPSSSHADVLACALDILPGRSNYPSELLPDAKRLVPHASCCRLGTKSNQEMTHDTRDQAGCKLWSPGWQPCAWPSTRTSSSAPRGAFCFSKERCVRSSISETDADSTFKSSRAVMKHNFLKNSAWQQLSTADVVSGCSYCMEVTYHHAPIKFQVTSMSAHTLLDNVLMWCSNNLTFIIMCSQEWDRQTDGYC